MYDEKQSGKESLTDIRARLLPEKQKMLSQLIDLDTESRALGGDILDEQRRKIGTLRRALTLEVGSPETLDRMLNEAYGQHLAEGERNRRAREAYRATKEAA